MNRVRKKDNKRNTIKGSLRADKLRLVIVYSRFNEPLTLALLDGAFDTLTRLGAKQKNVIVVEVPGAFEVPLAAKMAIKRFRPDAVICLSVVIKGATKHFDQVVFETAQGVRALSFSSEVPVILGMIAAENSQDALERCGIKQDNKGRHWAMSAVECANLINGIR